MPKRRKINGKQLLVAAGFAGMSLVGCDEAVVANLVAPEDSGMIDGGETSDAGGDSGAPVANLLPPPDSGPEDAGSFDAGGEVLDAGDPDDAGALEDAGSDAGAPVANLLPPPDSGPASES